MIGRPGLPLGRPYVDRYDPALRAVTVRVETEPGRSYRLGWLTEEGWRRQEQPEQRLAAWERGR